MHTPKAYLVGWRNRANVFAEGTQAIGPTLASGQEFLRVTGAKQQAIGAHSSLQRPSCSVSVSLLCITVSLCIV